MRAVAFAILACVCLCPRSHAADAPSSSPATISTPFDGDGYSVVTRPSQKNCLVGANIDLPAMLAGIADYQQHGVMRSDVDAKHVTAHAWTTASAIALKLQPFIIVELFKQHPEIGRCGFLQTITGSDGRHELAYAFDMTRAAYARTDWPAYSPQKLRGISENFRMGLVTARHMNAEAGH